MCIYPNGYGYDALYALERGGVRYYVASDHLGTPKIITDNTGMIVRQIEYDSWGVKVSDTNPSFDLPVGFAGGIPDDATGLVRFGFRDYEPGAGRWAAKDPIFFRGGQWNLYAYVRNSPITRKDRSGLASCTYNFQNPPTAEDLVREDGEDAWNEAMDKLTEAANQATEAGKEFVKDNALPFAVGAAVVYVTGNVKWGLTAAEITDSVQSFFRGQPTTIPKLPIVNMVPVINPTLRINI